MGIFLFTASQYEKFHSTQNKKINSLRVKNKKDFTPNLTLKGTDSDTFKNYKNVF